jgi:magnesium transporter
MSPAAQDHLHQPVLDHARRDVVRIRDDQTIAEALACVQQGPPPGRIVYFYVVDSENRLVGVVPTRRLLLNSPDTRVAEVMVRDVITLPATATLLDACELFMIRRLLALPVVDDERRILGVVDVDLYTDEITDLARREESDDIFQLIGVRLAQVRQASLPVLFGSRFPWLLCNMGGGLACALLAGLFADVLDRVIVLALFIPVVLALAESVSIQSLTLTLQAQHGPRIAWTAALRTLPRELLTGIWLGLASGAVVGLAAWAWKWQPLVAACIGLAIAGAVATAALFGFLVPTLLRRLQRDPKLASGPIVLAATDLATLFYYLGLAAWLLA